MAKQRSLFDCEGQLHEAIARVDAVRYALMLTDFEPTEEVLYGLHLILSDAIGEFRDVEKALDTSISAGKVPESGEKPDYSAIEV